MRAHPGPDPAGADRHAGGEPPGRALVDHGVLPIPGLLGPAKRFRTAVPGADRGARRTRRRPRALKRATGPFVLRRLKTDKSIISDLPEKQEIKVWCTLTPEQATLYQAVVDDMLAKIESSEGIERRGQRAGRDDQAQAGLQPPRPPAQGRLAAARPVGQAGPAGGVWPRRSSPRATRRWSSRSTPSSARCSSPTSPRTSTGRCCGCTAGCPRRQRDDLVDRFQNDDEPMLFLLSLKAAGTGLNLTAANHVIHVDRWWNPAVEDQATDRAFRIGQRANVQVRKFICAGTLEETRRRDDRARRRRWPSGSSAPARTG